VASVDPENPEGETSAAEEWRRFGQTAGYLMSGGFQLVAAAAAGTFVGRWIDRKIGTEPILTVVLATLGLVGGVMLLWRSIQTLQRRQAPRG